MRGRGSFAIVVGLLVALASQAAYATPSRVANELRAVRCCATHCAKAASIGRATRCCRAHAAPADLATLSKARGAEPPVTCCASASGSAVGSWRPAVASAARSRGAFERAAPIFLLTLSLRL